MEDIKKVQKRATKLVIAVRRERLTQLKIPSL